MGGIETPLSEVTVRGGNNLVEVFKGGSKGYYDFDGSGGGDLYAKRAGEFPGKNKFSGQRGFWGGKGKKNALQVGDGIQKGETGKVVVFSQVPRNRMGRGVTREKKSRGVGVKGISVRGEKTHKKGC